MNSRSQCREAIIEKLLSEVRRQVNRLWDNGEDPVACQLRDRRGYILDSVFIPPLPAEDSEPQPQRDESLSDTVSDEDDEEDDVISLDSLSPTEKRILAVMAEMSGPKKVTTIAARAGCRCNSHFRERMRRLVLKNRVRRIDECHYELI